MAEETAKVDRRTILEWATAAKRTAEAGDLDPMPSDESFIRAAVTFNMVTRGPWPMMQVAADRDVTDAFNRSSAIVMMAINIDDVPPNTPERASLFAQVLDADAEDDAPPVCGGCHAVGPEPHASDCPDERIRLDQEERRERGETDDADLEEDADA